VQRRSMGAISRRTVKKRPISPCYLWHGVVSALRRSFSPTLPPEAA
jgi:hypothetical protein